MASILRLSTRGAPFSRDAFASGLIPRLTDLGPPLRQSLVIRRNSIRREFAQGVEFLPSGGNRRWRRTRDFFGRKAPEKTLVRSGELLRSLQGEGPHAIEKVTDRAATFGTTLPYAAYHRAGARISITAKMRGFVLYLYGKTFRAGKRTIILPVRSFGAATPETREEINGMFLRYFATGKVATA